MKRIVIINGPNLNLLGRREPDKYGLSKLSDIRDSINKAFAGVAELTWLQSNHEGTLIDMLHSAALEGECDGVVLNAGAYTHTSLALADAIAAVAPLPVVEVHLTNIFAREEIRRRSLISPVCVGCIAGFGPMSYKLAVQALL